MADKINIVSLNTQDARRRHSSNVNWPGENSKEVVTKINNKGEVINELPKDRDKTESKEDQYTQN